MAGIGRAWGLDRPGEEDILGTLGAAAERHDIAGQLALHRLLFWVDIAFFAVAEVNPARRDPIETPCGHISPPGFGRSMSPETSFGEKQVRPLRPVARLQEKSGQLGRGVGDADPGRFESRDLFGRRTQSA
jgi:hypothetical protein